MTMQELKEKLSRLDEIAEEKKRIFEKLKSNPEAWGHCEIIDSDLYEWVLVVDDWKLYMKSDYHDLGVESNRLMLEIANGLLEAGFSLKDAMKISGFDVPGTLGTVDRYKSWFEEEGL